MLKEQEGYNISSRRQAIQNVKSPQPGGCGQRKTSYERVVGKPEVKINRYFLVSSGYPVNRKG